MKISPAPYTKRNNRRPLIAPESVFKLSASMHDQMNCSPAFALSCFRSWRLALARQPYRKTRYTIHNFHATYERSVNTFGPTGTALASFVLDGTAWSFGAEVAFDGEMMLKHTRFSMEPSGERMLEQCYTRRITEK